MRTSEENIRQLLEMLDHPDRYTEQEIQDIINRDEDTRETYRMMVEAKRSSRQRQDEQPVDVDAAWEKFSQKRQSKQHSFSWIKVAASFVGVLLVSGIAFAAIHIVIHSQPQAPKTEEVKEVANPSLSAHHSSLPADTISMPQPKLYDNVPLGEILKELSAYYSIKVKYVEYLGKDASSLRLYYRWKPEYTLQNVVDVLNEFEWLQLELENDTLFVKTTAIPAKDC